MTDINWHALAADASYSIRNLIEGELSIPGGETEITKHSARDGSLLYTFGEGLVEEVDRAVASAKAAYEDGRWADLSLGQRQAVLLKLADLIEENSQELALNECLDVGKPIANALGDVSTTAATFRDAANSAALLLHPSGSDGRVFC
jgi:4-guanidinobutyraldehyde dehydrogenase/NAD-dependent aldehyde dehydrogenase